MIRQETSFLGEDVLKFKTTEVGHSNVEHETAERMRVVLCQEFVCRCKRSQIQAGSTQ
jgi:hypothetical protein